MRKRRADVEVHFLALISENWPSRLSFLLPLMLRQALTIVLGFARSDLTKRALIRNAVVTCWNKLDAHLKRPHKRSRLFVIITSNLLQKENYRNSILFLESLQVGIAYNLKWFGFLKVSAGDIL